MVEIKAQDLEVMELQLKEVKDGVPKLLVKAINKALPKAKKTTKSAIADKFAIKPKYLNRDITTKRATKGDLKGSVDAKGKRNHYSNFKYSGKNPSGPGKIVKSTIFKGQTKVMEDNVFINTVSRTGKDMIFEREGSRKNFKALYAHSVPQMMDDEDILVKIDEDVQEIMDEEIEKEMRKLLRGG